MQPKGDDSQYSPEEQDQEGIDNERGSNANGETNIHIDELTKSKEGIVAIGGQVKLIK